MSRLDERLAKLATMSPAELRAEWLRVHKKPAPAFTADLLHRGLAYHAQEKELGSLERSIRDELVEIGRGLGRTAPVVTASIRVKPGTRLVRDWGGESHHVLVESDGFLYHNDRFASLSEIAGRITGAKWSGPRFFGLRSRAKRAGNA